MSILKSVKWQFYILSLQFLFVMLLILNLKICFPKADINQIFYKGIENLTNWLYLFLIFIFAIWFTKNSIKRVLLIFIVSILILMFSIKIEEFKIVIFCGIMIVMGRFFKYYLSRNKTLSAGLSKQIKNIQEQNLDPSSFIATYIVPMIAFQYKELQNFIVLIIYLVVVGKIYMNTKLYYTNPTLSLLGYKIYTIDTKNDKEIVLIIKDEVKREDYILVRELNEGIFLGRKKRKSEEIN